MPNILQKDHPVLREKARALTTEEIGSKKTLSVIEEMKTAMHSQKDGVAIAAPQVGHTVRIFLVAGAVLKKADRDYKGPEKDLVFINPKIKKFSREKIEMEEGCLSVRWLYGKVKRSNKVVLEALDENGTATTRGASGILSQIFQHECDHLNGVLFTDKAESVWEMSPEEIKDLQKRL